MEGTIGELRIFAGNFPPRNWAFCNGQLVAISQNTALYSVIGTIYGGDGRQTFALPDLRGRVPVSSGHGPGLSDYMIGNAGGSESNTLSIVQMPSHTHAAVGSINASNAKGTTSDPGNSYPAKANANIDRSTNVDVMAYSNTTNESMAPNGVTVNVQPTGSNAPINNMQPYLVLNWIICMYGEFPIRD